MSIKTPATSPSLTNSQRRLYKASYRPLTIPPEKQQETGRFLEKLAFLRGLDIQAQEFAQLEKDDATQAQSHLPTDNQGASSTLRVMESMKGLVADLSFTTMRRYGPLLANVSPEELIKVGNALAEMRSAVAADVRNKLHELQDRFAEASRSAVSGGASNIPSTVPVPMDAAVKWAMDERLPVYDEIQSIAARLLSAPDIGIAQASAGTLPMAISPVAISDLPRVLDQWASRAVNLVSAFQYQVQIEPVGELHLERIEMTPAGIEHGELVHSVPLTPKETVNITHREWSVTTQTFENIVQDSFEGFSETGVSEKTDLSQATDNETKHSSALDVNGSVSASYNGGAYSVTASAAVNYRQQTDTQQIEKDSVAHSLAITRNASTRTKKDHKISFRVSSVAGAEDLSVRVLTNPSDTNAMRVDYFQLLRKWRVDLIRYGLRMTYDLVIPNPGLDLIGRVLEIQAIDEMLTTAAYSFDVHITDVTPDKDKWLDLSQRYGVELDPPPNPSLPIAYFKKLDIAGQGIVTGDIEIEIPEGYEFADGSFYAELHLHVTTGVPRPQFSALGQIVGPKDDQHDPYNASLTIPLLPLFQKTVGKLLITYGYQNSSDGYVTVTGSANVLPKTIQDWQLKSWTALRNADQAAYDKRIEQAKERKAFLQAEIESFDALTLRKMEHEEIMRWVLRWLLGPAFDLMPANLKALLDPDPTKQPPPSQYAYPDVTTLSYDQWLSVIHYGEFIKYIHDAIEWENVLFFAYPYFWDYYKNWPFKRFLRHPDPIHREFLRSGAMRVVLTIRPGFEESFAMLQQTGDSTAPPDASFPYVTVAEEIRNFAMTNYEGIPPANPDNNVRPLLYPEQRKAWNDLQKLIRLIEDYNDAQHNRTLSTAITSFGTQTITPSSMEGIEYGTPLIIDSEPQSPTVPDPQETVIVTATTATTFTASFTKTHAAGVVFQIDPAVKMYPKTSQFPAAIQSFVGNAPLPLTDPWGHPYHYTSPGLNADYDLVSYGADGVAQKDQTDPKKLADPLNADITNYAEGSIVGRWYEYTPTSAMDVSINTVLPTTPQPA
jgi:Type II secretion system (T2SS), protein G